MKSSKWLLFPLIVLGLLGCSREGPRGPQGPMGPPGAGPGFIILTAQVQPSDWIPLGEPGDIDYQFEAFFDVPEIDQFVFDNGIVLGYLIEDGFSFLLPNTINFDEWITEYSMIYRVGEIYFIVKDSDRQTIPPAGPIEYRVVILDPDGLQIEKPEEMSYEDLVNSLEAQEFEPIKID